MPRFGRLRSVPDGDNRTTGGICQYDGPSNKSLEWCLSLAPSGRSVAVGNSSCYVMEEAATTLAAAEAACGGLGALADVPNQEFLLWLNQELMDRAGHPDTFDDGGDAFVRIYRQDTSSSDLGSQDLRSVWLNVFIRSGVLQRRVAGQTVPLPRAQFGGSQPDDGPNADGLYRVMTRHLYDAPVGQVSTEPLYAVCHYQAPEPAKDWAWCLQLAGASRAVLYGTSCFWNEARAWGPAPSRPSAS